MRRLVSTPIEVCEARDPKGLYAKAPPAWCRASPASAILRGPADADLVIDMTNLTVEEAAKSIILHLEGKGLHRRRRLTAPRCS